MLTDVIIAALNCHGYRDGAASFNTNINVDGVFVSCEKIHYYEPTHEVEGVLYTLPDMHILVMRGTEAGINQKKWYVNWMDILRDIRFIPWKTPFGWGHSGFYKGAKAWIDQHGGSIPSDKPLIISGHSMGAQIAVWLGFMSPVRPSRIVVFAEPRGFFATSKEEYRKRELDVITRSYITNRDWIEDVPPWGKRSVVPQYAGEGTHAISDYLAALKKRYQM